MEDIKREETFDNEGRPVVIISSPKFKEPFVISKAPNGFIFYQIRHSKGTTAEELTGSYTGLKEAEKALLRYISKAKETIAARRENFAAQRAERKKQNA